MGSGFGRSLLIAMSVLRQKRRSCGFVSIGSRLRRVERHPSTTGCVSKIATTVVVDQLDWADELDELGEAESAWIALLRREGHPLLNLAAGGLGPTGVEWTVEMRQAASIRATGRKIPGRFGEENPFYRRNHSPEQRARWSAARKGTNVGADNPNYGKVGADHPSFGRVMSEEAKARLSVSRTGAGNPNFGRSASEETRAKMSAVRKGRPMPSSRRSAHTRHHTNRGVKKATCRYCVEDSQ